MAEYYPALASTVSRLPNNNAATRKELYERARSNIVAQLRIRNPQISEEEILRERAALETAIRRVEAERLSYTPRFLTLNRPTTDVSGDSNVGVRRERLRKDEIKSRPVPAQPEEINTSQKRDDEYAPTLEPAPPNIRSQTTNDRRRIRRADGRSAVARRGRDLLGMYTDALGDPIRGPMLIGIAFVVGMMAFTGLLYAAIILTVRLAL